MNYPLYSIYCMCQTIASLSARWQFVAIFRMYVVYIRNEWEQTKRIGCNIICVMYIVHQHTNLCDIACQVLVLQIYQYQGCKMHTKKLYLGAIHQCQHFHECTNYTFSEPSPPHKRVHINIFWVPKIPMKIIKIWPKS